MTRTAATAARLTFAALLTIGFLPRLAHAGGGTTPIPTTGPTPIFNLGHFQCYEVHGDAIQPRTLSLRDQFGPSTARIRNVHRICNPASKNGEDPSAPQRPDHLVGYTIRQTTPRFRTIPDVEIINQFGTINVDVVRPEYLLVPSTKTHNSVPPPPSTTLDHFKCYRVKGKFRRAGITVADQFGSPSIVVDVKRPRRLCVPVNKNGEGIFDSADHLMCYQVRLARTSPPFTAAGQIFVNNQFGIDVLNAVRPTELCVPSFKNLTSCSVQRGVLPVCGGTCPPGRRCLFTGVDLGGPDMGGPDLGGPDMSGPECACRPASDACSAAPSGTCGGLCPSPNDACLFLAGPDMGGPDLGGPDMSGPETGCRCRSRGLGCGLGFGNICGGLCQGPDESCLSGPDMSGPELPGGVCGCHPSSAGCAAGTPPTCRGGLCVSPFDVCATFLSGPDQSGPETCGCTAF